MKLYYPVINRLVLSIRAIGLWNSDHKYIIITITQKIASFVFINHLGAQNLFALNKLLDFTFVGLFVDFLSHNNLFYFLSEYIPHFCGKLWEK